jgi:hypothetical protein
MQFHKERTILMNKDIVNKIVSVVNALNGIEVKGKTNLMNLSGSIAVLEDVCQEIINSTEETATKNTENNSKKK